MRRVLLVLLALSLIAGKKAKERRAALADPWSPESIEQALDTVIPLVEKHAGATFTSRPVVKLAEDVDIASLTLTQMEWAYAQILPDAPETLRRALAQNAAASMRGGALGVYNYISEEAYLMRRATQSMRQAAGIGPDHERDLMVVILAHEITHTLEDQVVGFKSMIRGVHDAEQFVALGCAWEGWATWVAGEVSKDLDIEDAFWRANALQGWDRNGVQNPGSFSVAFRYGQGYRFMDHHVTAGGTQQAWRTMREPPAHTGMIYRPERYDPVLQKPPRDYAALLEGADQALDKGPWAAMAGRVGEADLRAAAAFAREGQQEVDQMLGHLIWGHSVQLQRTDKDATFYVMDFDDEAAAIGWTQTMASHKTAQAQHDAATTGHAARRQITPLPELDADFAVERALFLPGARIPITHGIARRGTLVIVVQTERFIPGLRLERALAHVLRQLNE